MEINTNQVAGIKSCLRELSDLEFQRRVWVKGSDTEASSFNEVVCQLFDDYGLEELLQKKDQIVFTKEIDSLLRKISSLIDSIDDGLSQEKIIKLPIWKDVLYNSSKVLELINKLEEL